MEFSDRELIEEARGGSTVAFDRLMARYERLVFKIALGCTGSRENAPDIVQNVFLKVHRKLPRFRTDGSFRNWVARIAVNESANWKRARRRRPTEVLDEIRPPAALPDQEARISDRERWETVLRSMEALDPKHRAAVALRYFEGMAIREIAGILGLSEGGIKSILFRSVKKMRVLVEQATEVTV